MESVNNFVENILNNKIVVFVWAVIIVLVLFFILTKEGFLGEFRKAPVATQRPPALLGNGAFARFASEFSSTNQGGDNVVASNSANYKEHMVGGMEPPVIQSSTIPVGLAQWQRGAGFDNLKGGDPNDESFTGRANFVEGFSHDDILKQIIKGN
jgi:hypothetical protein